MVSQFTLSLAEGNHELLPIDRLRVSGIAMYLAHANLRN